MLLFKPLFAKALNLAEFASADSNLISKFESALYFWINANLGFINRTLYGANLAVRTVKFNSHPLIFNAICIKFKLKYAKFLKG
ncbi:hypothetical protein [Campylobacter showae]|uniref:hypothetical protein n=1 Tax=Campylobacter showae TaxID=204 RepID=UPI000F0848BE|nr:hypothetical protein [Campylobacter showae]